MAQLPVVLVVEDDWLVRDAITTHLRAARIPILEAHRGEVAISLLEAGERVDVLFTDIELGGKISGWSLAKRFRRLFPKRPVIYTSGAIKPDPQLAVSQSLFFPKPYRFDSILKACITAHAAPTCK